MLPLPFQFLAVWVGVWVARRQADQIEYLKTVNRTSLERLGKKRLRFTDAERRKLAVLGKKLGRKALAEVATIATPDTILRWYREFVAKSTTAARAEVQVDLALQRRSCGCSSRWRRRTVGGATRGCAVR
jgi:hypothetical protein